ncbi:MAG: hypothetical protein N3F11_01410 [Casimicrobiaceae bacterium]|nr:hypothetical protein [Casimicrobiaceae bacterium]
MSRPAASAQALSTPPQVRVGDRWIYRIDDRLRRMQFEERREVIALDADTITCEQRSDAPGYTNGRWVYTREWNLLSRPALGAPGDTEEETGRWVWEPMFPLFRFPLRVGDRLTGEARVRNAVTDTVNRHRFERTVLGRQSLRAPATDGGATMPSVAGRPPAVGMRTRQIAVWRVRYVARVTVEGSDPPIEWLNEETYDYAPEVNAVYAMSHRVTGPDGAVTRDAVTTLSRFLPA